MKLRNAGAKALAQTYLELDDSIEKAKADLIATAGEKAWLCSNEWSDRERAIYNLAWEQAKPVGLEYGIRALFGAEGIKQACDAYNVELLKLSAEKGV